MRTQLRLIKSRTLALEVVKTLGLDQHPEFVPKASQSDGTMQLLKQWGRMALTWGQAQASDWIARLRNALPERSPDTHETSTDTPKQAVAWGEPASRTPAEATATPFDRTGGDAVSDAASESAPMEDLARAKAAAESRVAHLIISRLKVTPIPLASMLNLSFQAYDPELAADVANTFSRLYVEQAKQSRFETVKEAMDWLQNRVDQMRDKVEISQLKLQQYKKEHGIYSLDDRLPGVMQEMAALNSALTQARTERIEYETLYKEMQRASLQDASLEWMPAVVGNEFIQELKRQLASLQRELNQVEKKYGVDHPKVIQLKADVAVQEEQIQAEVRKIVESTRTQFEMIQAREAALAEQFERLKQEAHELNEKAIHYDTLKREAQSDQRLSDLLLTRLKETSISTAETGSSRIRVVDEAEVPVAAINIRPTKTLTQAGMAGLILGLGLVFGLGYLDNSLKDPEEAERYLGFPVLGTISQYVPKRQLLKSGDAPETGLVALDAPRSPTAESYKMLRTNLLFTRCSSFLLLTFHSSVG